MPDHKSPAEPTPPPPELFESDAGVEPIKALTMLQETPHPEWASRSVKSMSFFDDGRLLVRLTGSEVVLFAVDANGQATQMGAMRLSDAAVQAALVKTLGVPFTGDRVTLNAALAAGDSMLIAIRSGTVGSLVRAEWDDAGQVVFRDGFVSPVFNDMTSPAELCVSKTLAALNTGFSLHVFDLAGPIKRTAAVDYPDDFLAKDIACGDRQIAVARQGRGVNIYDVTDPASPALARTIKPRERPVTQFGQFRSGGQGDARRVWWPSTGLLVGEDDLIRWNPGTAAEAEPASTHRLYANYVRADAADGVLVLESPGDLAVYEATPPFVPIAKLRRDVNDFAATVAVDARNRLVVLMSGLDSRLTMFRY